MGGGPSRFGGRVYRLPLGESHQLQKRDNHFTPISRALAPTLSHLAYSRLTSPARPLFAYTSDCSSPCNKISFGKSIPMNTILLMRVSSGAHAGPRSEPMSWCTPWKITFFSVPFI